MTCTGTRTSVVFKVGTFILLLTLITLVVGYASPFWARYQNKNVGLWERCNGGSCKSNIGAGQHYSSDWFIATQVLVSIALLIATVTTLLALMTLCIGCLALSRVSVMSIASWTALAGVLVIVGVILFGVQTMILFPSVTFGFAFFAVAIAGVMLIISAILFAVDKGIKT